MKEGWQTYKLQEITTKIGSGATPKGGKKSYKSEGISLFRSLNVYDRRFKVKGLAYIDEEQASKLSNVVVEEGDVLLNITGASIARCCIAPSHHLPARVNQHVSIIRPKPEAVNSDFLSALLTSRTYKNELLFTGDKAGATRQALTKSQLQNFSVTLPPLPEQKRIVSILDEAFAGIDQAITNTEKNLVNARELFESYLNNVFTQKGEGWEEKKLTEILNFQPRNGWSPPAKNHSDSGTPVVTLSSVTGFEFDLSKFKYTSATTKKDAHYWLEEDSLLITRSNTPELVGHVAVCSGLLEPTIYPDLIMKMKMNPSIALTRFVYYQLRSKRMRKLITDSAQGANPTMKKINKGIVQSFPISVPALSEQNEIADKLDSILTESRNLQSIYQQKLNSLQELKQSILQKAFSGRLN